MILIKKILKNNTFFTFFLFFLALFSCAFVTSAQTVTSNGHLFFDIANTKISQGDEININIMVNTGGQAINAVSGDFEIPKNFQLESIDTGNSFLDFWVVSPKAVDGAISFQGVAVKQPYQGESGLIFSIKGIVTAPGSLSFVFDSGTILADDGLGTNVLGSLKNLSLVVKNTQPIAENTTPVAGQIGTPSSSTIVTTNSSVNNPPTVLAIIPPYITSISSPINQSESFSLTGQGTPNATTKIQFQDITEPSFGSSFVRSIMRGYVKPPDVELENNNNGLFSYISPTNLIAGTYSAVPSYVSPKQKENIIGYGVTISIIGNTLGTVLGFIINGTVIIVPTLLLIILLIFFPWYFIKRWKQATNEKVKLKGQNRFYKPTRYKIVKIFAMIVGVEAYLVMIGWITGIEWMTRILSHGMNMKFPTALVFLFSAWGLYFICRSMRKNDERARIVLLLISFFIFLIMSLLLLSNLSGIPTGIENLFVQQQSSANAFGSGLPSLFTTIDFILFGITGMFSFFIDRGRYLRLKIFGFLIAIIGLIPAIGYIFNMPSLYDQLSPYTIAMAFSTSLCFILLGCGLLIVGYTKNPDDVL